MKNSTFQVRISDVEIAIMNRLKQQTGMTASQIVRELLRRAEITPIIHAVNLSDKTESNILTTSDNTKKRVGIKKTEEKIKTLLQSRPGEKLTARNVAEITGISQSNVIRILSAMTSNGECFSEPLDASRSRGSRNPAIYWIDLS